MVLLTAFGTGTLFIVAIIATCTAMEQIAVIDRFPLRARVPGLAMNLLQGPLTLAAAWPIRQFLQSLRIGPLIDIPLWNWLRPLGLAGYALQFLIVAMIADFLVYWRHRAEHKIFWKIHAVHHSPTELHGANDIGHPLQGIFDLLMVSLPMSLIQIDGPGTPIAVSFVLLLLTYYIHSPIDVHFGPLRKVLVDNRFHRIHHSIEPRHFDKNFGICFSMWDRWFGTAYDPAPDEWPEVGLADIAAPRTIVDYLLLPFRHWPQQGESPAANKGDGGCLSAASFASLSNRS